MSIKSDMLTFEIYSQPEIYELVLQQESSEIKVEVDFIDKLIKWGDLSRDGRILDIGCGTCPHSLELANIGYKVSGLDISPQMLDYSQKKAEDKGVQIELFNSDMRSFNLHKTFDAAICAHESILYITRNEEYYCHLDAVADHIVSGGIYYVVLDMANTWLHRFMDPNKGYRRYFSKEVVRGNKVIKVSMYSSPIDFRTSTYDWGITCKIIGNENNQLEKMIKSKSVLRVIMTQEFAAIVDANRRFEIVDIYGDYYFSPFHSKSKKRLVVLRKK